MAIAPNLIPLIVHEHCVGHLLARGRLGYEVFNRDDQSLGVYPTTNEAVAALVDASKQEAQP